jgi:hypothetical protein
VADAPRKNPAPLQSVVTGMGITFSGIFKAPAIWNKSALLQYSQHDSAGPWQSAPAVTLRHPSRADRL